MREVSEMSDAVGCEVTPCIQGKKGDLFSNQCKQ